MLLLRNASQIADFSNFGSLKSTETRIEHVRDMPGLSEALYFSNFGSLKSTETSARRALVPARLAISAISAR
jgi:hypothetical protein